MFRHMRHSVRAACGALHAPGSAAPPRPPRGGGRSRAFRLRQMEGLRRSDLEPDPRVQFAGWFEDARTAGGRLPEAVALATATPDGAPSARMVLLKGFDA